jgi:hypothetical protein
MGERISVAGPSTCGEGVREPASPDDGSIESWSTSRGPGDRSARAERESAGRSGNSCKGWHESDALAQQSLGARTAPASTLYIPMEVSDR